MLVPILSPIFAIDMKDLKEAASRIVYSTDFSTIADKRYRGYCIHLVCTGGQAEFRYNDRPFRIGPDDAAIITKAERVEIISRSADLQVEILAAPQAFLNNQLPANNYGIGGEISLFDNPVIPLGCEGARTIIRDIRNIRDRLGEQDHRFFSELMGSMTLTMMYDLFEYHSDHDDAAKASQRSSYVVRNLMSLLRSGHAAKHRSVAYYASCLNVSTKYLSDTVKRHTGKSVSYFIHRHTVPLIKTALDNPEISLTQIAESMHFSSLSYFSRYVTQHLGVSPQQYRLSRRPAPYSQEEERTEN